MRLAKGGWVCVGEAEHVHLNTYGAIPVYYWFLHDSLWLIFNLRWDYQRNFLPSQSTPNWIPFPSGMAALDRQGALIATFLTPLPHSDLCGSLFVTGPFLPSLSTRTLLTSSQTFISKAGKQSLVCQITEDSTAPGNGGCLSTSNGHFNVHWWSGQRGQTAKNHTDFEVGKKEVSP